MYRITRSIVGQFLIEKYQRQARESGYHNAARNLRKQGVPLDVALVILFAK
jgi:hypothetical protein